MSIAKKQTEVVFHLEDALRVLDLPNDDFGDGKTSASYSFKCGYSRASIELALLELRGIKAMPEEQA